MPIITIKAQKAFTEVKVQAEGIKDNILIGVKVYSRSELKQVRKDFTSLLKGSKIQRWLKELEIAQADLELSEDAVDAKVLELTNLIDATADAQEVGLDTFYKKHILYIKNATLTVTELEATKDLLIADTRNVTPLESLWDTPDECLVVLLDMYLENQSFRDSLQKAISDTVFNLVKGDEKLKN
jgi:hypothetical protein